MAAAREEPQWGDGGMRRLRRTVRGGRGGVHRLVERLRRGDAAGGWPVLVGGVRRAGHPDCHTESAHRGDVVAVDTGSAAGRWCLPGHPAVSQHRIHRAAPRRDPRREPRRRARIAGLPSGTGPGALADLGVEPVGRHSAGDPQPGTAGGRRHSGKVGRRYEGRRQASACLADCGYRVSIGVSHGTADALIAAALSLVRPR